MFSKTKIALCVAFVLGGAASAALASNENDDRGGFVVNGSMDGINPAYHPELFSTSAKAFDFVAPSSQLGRRHRKGSQR